MTSPKQPPAPETLGEDQQAVDAAVSKSKATVPAFSFPFKPGQFAAAKKDTQAWYQKSGKKGHDQTPGPAPHGTRKAMGKR